MNFKIQQTYPSPSHGLSSFNTLIYAENVNSLILYGEQAINEPVADQPKKKIAFKADKTASAPTLDKISVFSISQRKWSVIQAKGKIPTPRTDFICVYMEPCMIMYGGKIKGKLTNQVYALNCLNWTWKKLFILDGPPVSEKSIFFKISNTAAGLVTQSALWLLGISDVKWELTANELPGSVWEKSNIVLPENVEFCCSFDDFILTVGNKSTAKINFNTKQKQSQFQFISERIIKPTKLLNSFGNCLSNSQNSSLRTYCGYIVSPQTLTVIKYSNEQYESIDLVSDSSIFQLPSEIKCSCLFRHQKNQNNQNNQNQNTVTLFCLDTKNQLTSLQFQLQLSPPPSTARIIQSPQRPANILNSNSCILQQQQNEQSSLMIPSSNSQSRVHVNEKSVNDYGSISSQQVVNSQRMSKYEGLTVNAGGNVDRYPKITQQPEEYQNDQITKMKISQSQTQYGHNYNQNNQNQNNQNKAAHPKINNQRFKYKTEEHTHQKNKIMHNNSANMYQSNQQQQQPNNEQIEELQQKLHIILYHESVKRRALQSKIKMLQNMIKGSQQFVHELACYGSEEQKQKHIQKVKEIRQKIQSNLSKQQLYRRQMQGNRLPHQLNQQVQQTLSHIEF